MSEHTLKSVCLVGDRFASFARHESVRTVSSFVSAVGSGTYDDLAGPMLLWEGQGIDEFDRGYIRAALERAGLSRKILMQPNNPVIAARAEAHKYREANVLVAGLQRQDDRTYRAGLRLHSDNELLLDHQTGEHVQGMVAIEAFRQMFIAFCEKFVASQWPQRKYYYIWHSMEISFDNFLFPLDADITCVVTESDTSDPAKLKFTVEQELHQTGTRAAHARTTFTAFDAARLAPKEHRLAAAAVAKALGGGAEAPVAVA
ncbi:AfsA-related hotdog domain-containing protein [Streptomyces yaizuensis]|uniref:A-factor biosynthesis protein AfsA n=1 Tax=Streptomyces yaizuensis TaxID=2989713 RepID=A0ABQ5P9R6_9ACTN|nr:AfsA-related hotdog domain-containing protein [Streptomyces sp. YSPA8]GLF99334.1 A-factor biosynthesis protein AfsA [Streptomyces sp. YSPA8]